MINIDIWKKPNLKNKKIIRSKFNLRIIIINNKFMIKKKISFIFPFKNNNKSIIPYRKINILIFKETNNIIQLFQIKLIKKFK